MLAAATTTLLGETGALQLAAVVVVMLNALFSRESSKREHTELLEASGRRRIDDARLGAEPFREESDYEGDLHGLYFLSDIVLDKEPELRVPRLPNVSVRVFDASNLGKLFGFADLTVLRQEYGTDGLENTRNFKSNPTRTRKGLTHNILHEPQPLGERPRLGIRVPASLTFMARPRVHGADGGLDRARPDLPQALPKTGTLGVNPDDSVVDFLENIVAQMTVDMMTTAVNGKGASASCHLDLHPLLRRHATIEMFQTFDLRGVMGKAQVRFADRRLWNSTINHAFPDPAHWPKKKCQGYPSCLWYLQWEMVSKTQLTPPHAQVARNALLAACAEKLKWIPQFVSDRPWESKDRTTLSNLVMYPPDASPPALIILINPNFGDIARNGANATGLQFGVERTPEAEARLRFLRGEGEEEVTPDDEDDNN
jgi:hypothetical protein